LERLRHEPPVILALEPGGVPVGEVVAEELAAPFGVIAVARLRTTSRLDVPRRPLAGPSGGSVRRVSWRLRRRDRAGDRASR
jgi:hypothetical protein